jgi:hypothetical protein
MIALLPLLLTVSAMTQTTGETNEMNNSENWKLPFQEECLHCYDKLKESNEVYRAGFQSLVQLARDQAAPIGERAERIWNSHEEILRKGKSIPPRQGWREEDAYVCCVMDLYEAMFSHEAERIIARNNAQDLKALRKKLEEVPFGNPHWNTRIKPRIRKELKAALDRLSSDEGR